MRRVYWLTPLLGFWPLRLAWATDIDDPRTKAEFVDPPCVLVLDRSDDPVLHIEYQVAKDEFELAEDELPDSRRHQFFAFSQPYIGLPEWISQNDVDRSVAAELIGPDQLLPDDILEQSGLISAASWVALQPNDSRLEITRERAALGVDWDTRGLATGSYRISVYTWHPPKNVWGHRKGVIKVVDNPDPASSPPALAITGWSSEIELGGSYTFPACADVAPGTTMTLSWGAALPDFEAIEWNPIYEDQVVESGAFEIDFESTPGLGQGGKTLYLRLDAKDPQGRESSAISPSLSIVGDDPDPEDESETGHEDPDSENATTTEDSSSSGSDNEGDEEEDSEPDPQGDASGGDEESSSCNISARHQKTGPVPGLLFAAILLFRRRRCSQRELG